MLFLNSQFGQDIIVKLLNQHHMVLLSTITLGLNEFSNSFWSQSIY